MSTPRNTVERIHPRYFRTKEKILLYLRHVFAYEEACRRIGASDRVLEIGFGDGYGTAMLAGRAASVVAVDVEAETVAHAARTYPGLDFRAYDGKTLPFDAAAFDAVVAFQVIEHVEDDRGFAAEIRRVLRPGGLALVTTPNRAYRVAPGAPLWNPFHVREYLAGELEAVLRTAFDAVEVRGIRGDAEVQRIEHARVRRGLSVRKLIPEPVRAWLDGDAADRYTTDVYHLTDAAEDGLDLLGVCGRAVEGRVFDKGNSEKRAPGA